MSYVHIVYFFHMNLCLFQKIYIQDEKIEKFIFYHNLILIDLWHTFFSFSSFFNMAHIWLIYCGKNLRENIFSWRVDQKPSIFERWTPLLIIRPWYTLKLCDIDFKSFHTQLQGGLSVIKSLIVIKQYYSCAKSCYH